MFTESRGVALWWPFTNYRYKLRLPNPIEYTWRDSSLSQFLIDVLKLCLMEFVIFGPILIAVLLIKHRTRAKDVLAAN
jgi:hypothetical protein